MSAKRGVKNRKVGEIRARMAQLSPEARLWHQIIVFFLPRPELT